MSSKYDSIKTATELVKEVMAHGLSLKQEDLTRAQDIVGHSTIEELAFLANDIGRNNENGEPDPKGTMSSGRRPTRPIFYQILFNIWNWEDATRFWNQHSNPEREELKELRSSNADLRKKLDQEVDFRKHVEESNAAFLEETKKVQLERKELSERLAAAEDEIIRLKAKLYDMMMKEG